MRESEAYELGLHYTGMCSASYDTSSWEKELNRAKAIKKMYKGADYRVVTKRCQTRYGSEQWKVIYGNDIFCKVQYFNQTREEEWINETYQQRLLALQQKYEKELNELKEYHEKRVKNYIEIMAIKKK